MFENNVKKCPDCQALLTVKDFGSVEYWVCVPCKKMIEKTTSLDVEKKCPLDGSSLQNHYPSSNEVWLCPNCLKHFTEEELQYVEFQKLEFFKAEAQKLELERRRKYAPY